MNVDDTNPIQINNYTFDCIDGGFYYLSACKVNILTNFNGLVALGDVPEIYADTLVMLSGNHVMVTCNVGTISEATIYAYTGQNCTLEYCNLDGIQATNCVFNQCTLIHTPWENNSFKSMFNS